MNFTTHQLTEPLKSHVETIFHFENFMPEHSIERVVPTGHVFLIFELDGYKRHTFDNETLKVNGSFTHVWLSGVHKNYLSISAHKNSQMLVIQFKPSGAYSFINQPMDQLCEQVILAKKIFGNAVLGLREKLINQTEVMNKFALVENWLTQLLIVENKTPKQILNIINQLQINPMTKHKKIIDNYTQSHKHLINQFKKYVGLTPKYFHRIMRFNEVLQQLQQSKKIEWASLAFEFGYTDQSHFIKDFKHFSGFNPEKFIKNNYHQDEPNFFPLNKK